MGRRAKTGSGTTAVMAALLCLPALVDSIPVAAGEQGACVTARGVYQVRYRSELQPIHINTLHAWVLLVQTAEGKPVSDAVIEIGGGMPQHDHGLPTRPQVTADPGAGNYRIEGLRFHMQGEWQLSVSISTGTGTEVDTCVISLQL